MEAIALMVPDCDKVTTVVYMIELLILHRLRPNQQQSMLIEDLKIVFLVGPWSLQMTGKLLRMCVCVCVCVCVCLE